MKKILLIVCMSCCAVFLTAAEITAVEGRVIKAPLNVRAGAGMKYTSVAKLAKFNQVKVVGVSKNWLKIVPPDNCRVWVLERYVKNNKLTATVNFRSGPGTGYEAVGTGRRGLSVSVADKATPSGWVPLKVPASGVVYYVGRPAIEVDAEKLAILPKFSSAGPSLPNEDLIRLEVNFTSKGKKVTARGFVYKEGTKPITHTLFEEKGESLLPKYFLLPARNKITAADGKQLLVVGECYNVKGWDIPVIVVTNWVVRN